MGMGQRWGPGAVLVVVACAAAAGHASGQDSAACPQAMYDWVAQEPKGVEKRWMATVGASTNYNEAKFNCVNNTDFWLHHVQGFEGRPMQLSDAWFKNSGNCQPYQHGKDEKLEFDRNPARHWKEKMSKLQGTHLVRVALINQHELNKEKAQTEKRKCKGAHALSFFADPSKKMMYQLPSAWVNMYSAEDWVKSYGNKPQAFTFDDFFNTLWTMFTVSKTSNPRLCKRKWDAFKKIFMPKAGSEKSFAEYEIPPVFANKGDGHSHIDKSTTCAKDNKEWFTEPNDSFKSPYWRDIIFITKPTSVAECIARVNSCRKDGQCPGRPNGPSKGESTPKIGEKAKFKCTKVALRGASDDSTPTAFVSEADVEGDESKPCPRGSVASHVDQDGSEEGSGDADGATHEGHSHHNHHHFHPQHHHQARHHHHHRHRRHHHHLHHNSHLDGDGLRFRDPAHAGHGTGQGQKQQQPQHQEQQQRQGQQRQGQQPPHHEEQHHQSQPQKKPEQQQQQQQQQRQGQQQHHEEQHHQGQPPKQPEQHQAQQQQQQQPLRQGQQQTNQEQQAKQEAEHVPTDHEDGYY